MFALPFAIAVDIVLIHELNVNENRIHTATAFYYYCLMSHLNVTYDAISISSSNIKISLKAFFYLPNVVYRP